MNTTDVQTSQSPAGERLSRRVVLEVRRGIAMQFDRDGAGLEDRLRVSSWTAEDAAELARLERRGHYPETFEEFVAWRREFGAEQDAENEALHRKLGLHETARERAAARREWIKTHAEKFGVPYEAVKEAVATTVGL